MKEDSVTAFILVFTNTASRDEAVQIAHETLNRKVVAAVNIVGPITSLYDWEGKRETTEEWQCILKTKKDFFPEVERTIKELHSYTVPGIIAIPVESGSSEYFRWFDTVLTRQQEKQCCSLSKTILIHMLRSGYQLLLDIADMIEQQVVTFEASTWSVKEILIHIAAWADDFVMCIEEQIISHGYEHDLFNEQAIHEHSQECYQQIREWLQNSSETLMQALANLDPMSIEVEQRALRVVEHLAEHIEQMREQMRQKELDTKEPSHG